MTGFKDFSDGSVLTAGEVDTYLMRQSVMRFPSDFERDQTLVAGVVADGMFVYTTADATLWVREAGAWKALESKWFDFSATLQWTGTTNPAFGNATKTARWRYSGGLVEGYIKITMGSTTTYGSGNWQLSLPVNTHSDLAFTGSIAQATCFDTSAGVLQPRLGFTVGAASTISLGSDTGARVTNLSPFTWASGDILNVTFRYRPA